MNEPTDKTERKRLAHHLAVRNFRKRQAIDALAYALERLHQLPRGDKIPAAVIGDVDMCIQAAIENLRDV